MFFNPYPKFFFLSLVLLIPLQSCYLFCLFKADPILEETVERFLEHEISEMTNQDDS